MHDSLYYPHLKYLIDYIKTPITWSNIHMAGDERIELPTKVLETPIIPFN